MQVLGLLCVCSAVTVKLVGDSRLYYGFLSILLFIDWARVVELAPIESLEMLLLLVWPIVEFVVVVNFKN